MRNLCVSLAAFALLSAGVAPAFAARGDSLEAVAATHLPDQSGQPAVLAGTGEHTLIVYYRGDW